ncbi:MAG: helix-turn-helix domain-containing protein [Culicoidibacterales bacterium]
MWKRRGITQSQLAEFIGITKTSVSKWERGQSSPRFYCYQN